MRLDVSFPKQILIAFVSIGALAAYPLVKYGSDEILKAATAGALLTTVNVLIGYAAIEYSFGKSTATFFKFVLGGMGIRMFFMAAVLVLLLRGLDFNAPALVGSMGVFYAVFLTLEVLFIQKKVSLKQQG
jgi:hypothetical protein